MGFCTHQFTHAFAILIMIHSIKCMVSRLHDVIKVSVRCHAASSGRRGPSPLAESAACLLQQAREKAKFGSTQAYCPVLGSLLKIAGHK